MTPLLLVNSNGDFADDLIHTSVRKFIAQPFHFARGKFVASARGGALDLMTEKPNTWNATGSSLPYSTTGSWTTACLPWARGRTGLRRLSRLC